MTNFHFWVGSHPSYGHEPSDLSFHCIDFLLDLKCKIYLIIVMSL